MTQQILAEQPNHHYHVLHGLQGGYMPNANYFAEDMSMATDLAHREAEMDREEGRNVTKVTDREWHIREGNTDYILEITDCFEEECYYPYCHDHVGKAE